MDQDWAVTNSGRQRFMKSRRLSALYLTVLYLKLNLQNLTFKIVFITVDLITRLLKIGSFHNQTAGAYKVHVSLDKSKFIHKKQNYKWINVNGCTFKKKKKKF